MTPTTDLGLSIRLSMFELRETGDWDIFLGPPERARAETGGKYLIFSLLGVREPRHQTPQNCCAPVQRAPPGPGPGRDASAMVRGS